MAELSHLVESKKANQLLHLSRGEGVETGGFIRKCATVQQHTVRQQYRTAPFNEGLITQKVIYLPITVCRQ